MGKMCGKNFSISRELDLKYLIQVIEVYHPSRVGLEIVQVSDHGQNLIPSLVLKNSESCVLYCRDREGCHFIQDFLQICALH